MVQRGDAQRVVHRPDARQTEQRPFLLSCVLSPTPTGETVRRERVVNLTPNADSSLNTLLMNDKVFRTWYKDSQREYYLSGKATWSGLA